MALGIDLARAGGPARAAMTQRYAFDYGLIIELCGRRDEVIKILPPLNIDTGQLEQGIGILRGALRATRPAAEHEESSHV
jgi:diaminobutyrate-2-oxoglutarate transaminase